MIADSVLCDPETLSVKLCKCPNTDVLYYRAAQCDYEAL